jgi:glycosyltransferase involved in cell wall biosynthesis
MPHSKISKGQFLLSVVIPVYNEAGTISTILDRVIFAPFRKEIIVVDDGSTDGTRQILEDTKNKAIKICYHDRNYGKGRALQTGFSAAAGDVIVVQDADIRGADFLLRADIRRGKKDQLA